MMLGVVAPFVAVVANRGRTGSGFPGLPGLPGLKGLTGVNSFKFENKRAGQVSAEADESKMFTVSGPAKLDVDEVSGNITVTGGAGSEVVVACHKMAWGDKEADAKAELEKMKVVVTQKGATITARVELPKTPNVHIQGNVHFTVTVPTETAVIAHTEYGDVVHTGTTGDAHLKSSSGKIKVKDVKGELQLHSDYGAITAEEIVATTMKAHSSSGSVTATNVRAKGNVSLTSDYGAVEYSSGEAEARSESTRLNSSHIQKSRMPSSA